MKAIQITIGTGILLIPVAGLIWAMVLDMGWKGTLVALGIVFLTAVCIVGGVALIMKGVESDNGSKPEDHG